MVNFGLNSAAILGIFLAVAGAGLYFVRSIRPELSRDYDIFFAAVGIVCGFILLTNGWRLDPILQFGQFLLAGSTIFFAFEAIRLRGIATDQAKRNTPIVDEDRPVSRNYREARVYREPELDELEPYEEERYEKRRLRGYQDPRSSRKMGYEADDPRNLRIRGNGSGTERPTSRERPRRPRSSESQPSRYDEWQDRGEQWNERTTSTSRRPRRPRPEDELDEASPRPRRRRPRPTESDFTSPREREQTRSDYVDYQPIDKPERGRPNLDKSEDDERYEDFEY